jgi:hypothetical protein
VIVHSQSVEVTFPAVHRALLRARIQASPAGCTVWTKDLDRNGKDDVIVASFDDGVDTTVTVILIDERNLPVPWTVSGRFRTDLKGIAELVDTDHDHLTEIVVPNRSHASWPSIPYWTLYKFRNASVIRSDGMYSTMRFPLLGRGLTPKDASDDLSITVRGDTGFRQGVLLAVEPKSCGVELPNSTGCAVSRVRVSEQASSGAQLPSAWIIPQMLVIEPKADYREVYLTPAEGTIALGRLVGQRIRWRTMGRVENGAYVVILTVVP